MNPPHAIRRRAFLAATLATAVSAGTACGFEGGKGADGEGAEGGSTLRVSMVPIAHLDPAITGNASNGQIIMAGLWEGLVVHDADDPSNVLPGVAEEWAVSDDLLTYRFRLRDNAKWSNGDPVTARDFTWNWKRILTPGIAGEELPSYNHNVIGVVGAAAYMSGEIDDFADVGVKAVENTLELTLETPNPTFLLQLAQSTFLPLHPATVRKLGDHEWLDPSTWVSNGAYVLTDFRVNQGAVLLPNKHYWDRDNYHIDRWEISFNDGGTTNDLLAFQNDEIDVTGRIEDDLEAVTTSDVADDLLTSPDNQIRQLIVMNSRNPTLHDVRVRKALSMAIDRKTLGQAGKPAIPGNSMTPDAVEDSDQVPGVEYDVSGALALLDDASYPNGEGMPTITLLDYQSSPWVEAVAQMWRDNLHLEVSVDVVERGVFLEKRLELHPEDYTGFYAINTSISPPSLQTAAQQVLPAAPTAGIFGLNLVPVDVAEKFVDASETGADPEELLAILDGNRYPEAAKVIALANRAIAETDPATQRALLVDTAIARDETYAEIPLLWGGYNLIVAPHVENLRLWPFTSVFTTKGVTIER